MAGQRKPKSRAKPHPIKPKGRRAPLVKPKPGAGMATASVDSIGAGIAP
jgi:hypothetical protein